MTALRQAQGPGWSPATERRLRIAAPIVVGVVGLTAWQLMVTVGGVSDYLLPSPASIAAEFAEFWQPILGATFVTGLNALIGLIVGTVSAIVLAAFAARWRFVDGMSSPLVAAIAVVPIVALAPVLNSMFGADSQFGRQTIAGLAAFVPVFVNTLRGLRQTTAVHRDLMKAYAASGAQTFRTVTMPTAVPYLMTGIRIASSLAVISALVAEYFGGPRGGLGSFISTSAATSAYALAWAYVAAAIGLGLIFYVVTGLLERLVQLSVPGGGAR
ncbi:ABC transporter permease subunit [Planococcus sp. APC 4015]|nr:ABC transporter permease subunit [Planococcus sp. APC 4015]